MVVGRAQAGGEGAGLGDPRQDLPWSAGWCLGEGTGQSGSHADGVAAGRGGRWAAGRAAWSQLRRRAGPAVGVHPWVDVLVGLLQGAGRCCPPWEDVLVTQTSFK